MWFSSNPNPGRDPNLRFKLAMFLAWLGAPNLPNLESLFTSRYAAPSCTLHLTPCTLHLEVSNLNLLRPRNVTVCTNFVILLYLYLTASTASYCIIFFSHTLFESNIAFSRCIDLLFWLVYVHALIIERVSSATSDYKF